MNKRRIHRTSLELTELSFGAAGLGNLYRSVSDTDARSTIDRAWDLGIRYFDTAPHYGLGLSERRLGEALKNRPRDQYLVSSKVGRLLVTNKAPASRDDDLFEVPGDLRREWDFSRDGILRSVEQTLQRMQLDRLDILYLHDPDVSEIPNAARTGADALIELRDQGVVDAVGIGSNNADAIAHLFRTSDIDLAMVAGRYTLLEPRGADAIFESAGERSIVAAGVFNSGLLSRRRPDTESTYNYGPVPADVLERTQELADRAERNETTLPTAALQYPLRHPQIVSVTVGMRTPLEVAQNVAQLDAQVSGEAWISLMRA